MASWKLDLRSTILDARLMRMRASDVFAQSVQSGVYIAIDTTRSNSATVL
jgi:hypothetical protein